MSQLCKLEFMPTVRFNRIVQNDGNLRSLSIYVNDKKVGSLKPGQEYLDVELESGEHQLQASLTPFYRSSKTAVEVKDSDNHNFHVGLVYKSVFEGLLPSALKILPSEEYMADRSDKNRHLPLTSKRLAVVVVSGVCSGLLLLLAWHQQVPVSKYSYAIPLMGAAAIGGALLTIYFNRAGAKSYFPLYKPILDAGALCFLMTMLTTSDDLYWVSGAVIFLLVVLTVYNNYKR